MRRLSTLPWVRGRTDRFRRHRLRARRRGGLRSPFLCTDQDAMTSNEEHATLRAQRDGAYETIRDCQAKFLIRRCPRTCSAVPVRTRRNQRLSAPDEVPRRCSPSP